MSDLPSIPQDSSDQCRRYVRAKRRLRPPNNHSAAQVNIRKRGKCWNAQIGIISTTKCKNCPTRSSKSRREVRYVKFIYSKHGSILLKEFCKLRKEGRYLDCAIKVDSVTILANKSILSSFSDYFEARFRYDDHPLMRRKHLYPNQSREMHHPIELNHLSRSFLAAIVDCAYSGHITVPPSEFSDLLHAAEFLCIQSLTKSSPSDHAVCNRKEYLSKLVGDFCAWRRENKFVDCVIAVGSLAVGSLLISAHQLVLSAFSEYFSDIFRSNRNDHLQGEKTIDLFHLHPACVEALLKYAYTGEIIIPTCQIIPLIQTAEYLRVHCILTSLYTYLYKTLNTNNCLSIYKEARILKNDRLIADVKRYILWNFHEVSGTDRLFRLNINAMMELITDDKLEILQLYQCEKSVYRYFFVPPQRQEELLLCCIFYYVNHSAKNYAHFSRLLTCGVRLPLLFSTVLSQLLVAGESSGQDLWLLNKIREAMKQNQEIEAASQFPESFVATLSTVNANKKRKRKREGTISYWKTPRRSNSRMGFTSIKITGTDLYLPSNQSAMFDDSQLNIPVQYVTGMKMYFRRRNNIFFLAGVLVTYNNDTRTSILHGDDKCGDNVHELILGNIERITKVQFTTLSPEGYLIRTLGLKTNRGLRWGYFSGLSHELTQPEHSLYLAYLTGSVDVIDDLPTLRDVEFVWATDTLSSRSYDEDNYQRLVGSKRDKKK